MRNNAEYQLCKAIATYLRLQYPKVLFHFDYAGLNLSKAQAGRMKGIQGQRGFPDLFIIEPQKGFHGLFIEVKKEGEKILKRDGNYITDHISKQCEYILTLEKKGYMAKFGIGFDECKKIIDDYLTQDFKNKLKSLDN